MPSRVDTATGVALAFAAVVALGMGAVVAELPLAWSLGVGLLVVIVVVAVANNELALYLLILSMLLGPQVLVGGLGENSNLGRGLTLRLDDLLIVIVGLAWMAKTALHKELGLVFRTPLNRPIAAFAVAALFSTGLGMAAGRVTVLGGFFFVLKYIQYFVIYFMVVNNLRDRAQCRRFLIALLLTAAMVSVVGILQIPSGQRVSAPFEGSRSGEPNTFGGYLVLMLALTGALFLEVQSTARRAALAGVGGLVLVPLLYTLSRASYLAVPFLGLALLLWTRSKLLLAGLLVVGLALAPFVLPQTIIDRVLFTVTQPENPAQIQVGDVRIDSSTADRLRSWHEVLVEDWPKHPLFGYGVTGYRFLDAQYPRVLAETGLVGLAAFLWLQIALFVEGRRVLALARDDLFRGIALGFLCGLIAMIVHSIGSNTFIIVRIMEPFWFLAGMVVRLPALQAAEDAPEPARRGVVASARWPAALGPAGAVGR
jgi:hypothetical protein